VTVFVANGILGLQKWIKGRKDALVKAQKREQTTGRSTPGNIASRVMEIVEMEQLATTLVRLFTDKELDAAVKEVDPCNTCEHRDSLQDDHGGCVEEQDCSELSGLTPAEMEAVLAARIEGRRP
jgi:hypothetical protein